MGNYTNNVGFVSDGPGDARADLGGLTIKDSNSDKGYALRLDGSPLGFQKFASNDLQGRDASKVCSDSTLQLEKALCVCCTQRASQSCKTVETKSCNLLRLCPLEHICFLTLTNVSAKIKGISKRKVENDRSPSLLITFHLREFFLTIFCLQVTGGGSSR